MSEHRFIVQVLQHGWFESNSDYFIDMELCVLTLHDYIHNRAPFIEQNPDLSNHAQFFVADNCSAHLKVLNIWTIINHIAQGLSFIHQAHFTHRDIKPPNSNFVTLKRADYSTLLSSNKFMEDCGFWNCV
jgi:serine/threonine protein kinase